VLGLRPILFAHFTIYILLRNEGQLSETQTNNETSNYTQVTLPWVAPDFSVYTQLKSNRCHHRHNIHFRHSADIETPSPDPIFS